MSKVGYDVDRETHALELLKLRFGEHNLHKCEVMLKDMRDSKRLNTNIKAPLAPGTPGAAVDDAHETTETLRKRYVLHFPNCISQFDHTKLTLFWQTSKVVAAAKSEVGNLERVVSSLSHEKELLRKEHDVVTADRDVLGTQLVKRNDELALLYEKIKIQQTVLNNGQRQVRPYGFSQIQAQRLMPRMACVYASLTTTME